MFQLLVEKSTPKHTGLTREVVPEHLIGQCCCGGLSPALCQRFTADYQCAQASQRQHLATGCT
jgi:hypothetical protein